MKFFVVDDEKVVEMLFGQKFRKEIRSGKLEVVIAFSSNEANLDSFKRRGEQAVFNECDNQ